MLSIVILISKTLLIWLIVQSGGMFSFPFDITYLTFMLYSSHASASVAAARPDIQDFPSAGQAKIRAITTHHFIIKYTMADQVSAEFLMREAEPAYTKVVNYLGSDPRAKIQIFLAPDISTFELLQPPRQEGPGWAAGLAYPGKNLILMKSLRLLPNSSPGLKETLLHELTHILIDKILGTKNSLPRWLNEGLAMYIAGQWGAQETINLTRISLLDTFIPMSKLNYSFPHEEKKALQAYTQSFSLVSYLAQNYGIASLNKLIRSFMENENSEMAFELTFGMSLSSLERDWRAFIRLRYTWLPTIVSGTTIWFLIAWLVIGGYLTKRRANKSKLLRWEEEEAQEVWHNYKQ